jgi:outer membrane receptor protein involved in Fe transport
MYLFHAKFSAMIKNYFRFFAMSTVLSLCSVFAFAQATIQGSVKSIDGATLSKCAVQIQSLGLGTTTDDQGNFKMNSIPNGYHILEISHVGFETENVAVNMAGANQNLTVVLDQVSKAMKEVVITGVSNPKSTLESSISITSLRARDINNAVPRTTAEIFRTIPGIRSESSGGEGNSNITVRGVPVSAGGSRYMLLQEDGLPVLQFGDIAFGTQDQFIRFDNTIQRIEAVRGGSASVLASNSPAGIINFISKTGETEGGSIATNLGIDNRFFRTDFEVGSPIGNNLFMHVGGFYRTGDGPRKTGYTSNNGGQFKANLTKKFEGGYARLYVKVLNDRSAGYMPMPIEVSGTNASPKWTSLANFDALHGALQSPYLLRDLTIGGDGNRFASDVADGMHSVTHSIGGELALNIGKGWKMMNRSRMAFNQGQFLAPFPASAGSLTSLLNSIPGAQSASYAGSGLPIKADATVMRIHLFNTTLNNFNNYSNDLSINKQVVDEVRVNLGLYKAMQHVSMSWNWNTYLMDANSDAMQLINVTDTNGAALTTNGLLAYGTPAWGNCCSRNYDTRYDITAPYASVEIKATESLTFDVGARYDMGHVFGGFSGGNGQTATIDMNGNGAIDKNETAVATTSSVVTPVDYRYNFLSYSIGANYKLDENQSLFVRTSSGGSASADRVLFSGYAYTGDSSAALDAQKVNRVSQTELGYKYRKNKLALNATAFYALTTESNYEATTQRKTNNKYRSMGLELDAVCSITNDFGFRGGLTFTQAKIIEAIDTSIVDNTPRRLPMIMFNLAPYYNLGKGNSVGLTILGFTKSFAQDNNKLVMPGYLVLNPYVNLAITKNFMFNLSGNNILDALGITEAEEGSITENQTNIVRGRPIPGRTISAGLRFNF